MQNQPEERADGSVRADVFGGQVLSLHPLSGFFMLDPALCAVAGKFFASDAYDLTFGQRQGDSCKEYWDLIGAIIMAAHLYKQAADEQAQRRDYRDRRV